LVITAFSKNGLYFAMTAIVSTNGLLADARVSATIFALNLIVRYLGCVWLRRRF
jgi:hypothetical protein